MFKKASHFVIRLSAVTTSGKLLNPGFITKRCFENQGADKMSFLAYSGPLRYNSSKAFVSKEIFAHFIYASIFDYILKMPLKLGSFHTHAVILYDGR